MDGQFVPVITFGADTIAAIRPVVSVPFEAHMMIEKPEQMLKPMYDAGCETLIVHAETTRHLHRTLGACPRARCASRGGDQPRYSSLRRWHTCSTSSTMCW